MPIWIVYTVICAIFIGFFQVSKKKALEKNSIYEVLAAFSFIAFVLVSFISKNVFDIENIYIFSILGKSLIIIVSWIFGLYAIDKMPISLYCVINLSGIIFSIILSIIFLGEQLTLSIIIGAFFIILGLFLVNKSSSKKEEKETNLKVVLILLVSCLLSSISSIIDKEVLKHISSEQLQFWFLLFLTLGFCLISLFKKQKMDLKKIKNNYWIIIAAISLVVGDRFLFMANENPESKVSMIILVKQMYAIEGIVLGKIFLNEKNIVKKLLCSLLIILGVGFTIL